MKFKSNVDGAAAETADGGPLTLPWLEVPRMQPQEPGEGPLTDTHKESGVRQRMKISQMK